MIKEAEICLKWYLSGIGILLLETFCNTFGISYLFLLYQNFILLALYVSVTNICAFWFFNENKGFYQVAVRALNLGHVFGLAVILATSESSFRLFGWYAASLSFFHCSEYFITAYTNPNTLSLGSFLLDHSVAYHVAALMSFLEFTVDWYFFPTFKQPCWLSVIGCLLVIGGEALRKLAMVTASTNFNHYVQDERKNDHELVKAGVYSLFRHPSYVGWFYWSIGTQIMLGNPICIVGFTYASWSFFNNRIYHEEISLLKFFGEDYANYQKEVPTGLPFIKGFILT